MKTIGKILVITHARWWSNKKNWLVIAASLLFSAYTYLPLTKLTMFFHGKIPPVAFVFYMSFFQMLVLQGGVSTLMYADFYGEDEFTLWSIQRVGRIRFLTSQMIYIILVSAIYVSFLVILSWLFTIPVIGIHNKWGKILKTLGSSDLMKMSEVSGVTMTYGFSSMIMDTLTPYGALGFSALFMWLTTIFIGFIQLFSSVLFTRMTGIIICGVFIAMTLFSMFSGFITLGKWLFFISPLSWNNISVLDWYKTGTMPSWQYGVIFLVTSILIMGVISVIRFSGKDLS